MRLCGDSWIRRRLEGLSNVDDDLVVAEEFLTAHLTEAELGTEYLAAFIAASPAGSPWTHLILGRRRTRTAELQNAHRFGPG